MYGDRFIGPLAVFILRDDEKRLKNFTVLLECTVLIFCGRECNREEREREREKERKR
jgi:hypothetical protein